MKTFLLLLLLYSSIAAKLIEPNPLDQQIISHTFNEEFDQAEKLCQEQININPNSPKYYYYLINVKILEYHQKVAELDPDKRSGGRKVLNKEIIDYCESVIDKFDDSKLNLENKFYYGTIYGYLARIYGIDGSWWSAFKSGMKSKKIMEEIIKNDPQFYDAYLPLGMFNYYADRLSGITSFVAGILGFSGNREQGLNYLQLAYNKGTLTFGQSALTLIEVYQGLEGNEYAALPYYEAFLKRFPRNSRVLNAYCQNLMDLLDFKTAEELIKNDKQNLIDDYAKARFYDAKGNSQLAIQLGERALGNEKKLYRGGGNAVRYIIVFNSWLTGDIARIKKYEPTLSNRYKEMFAVVKSNEKNARWLRDLSINIANDEAVSDIENFVRSKPSFNNAKELDGQFNFLLGEFYFKNDLLEKAEQYFNKAAYSTNEHDKNSAMIYLIQIYLKQTVDKNKVKNLISLIDKSDNPRLTYLSKGLEKKYNL
ncbi:MAG: hypothetical protein M1495_12570 [Bacteroidetes bacterium]|nr:hypothetical protein [Bacteroidota bacterium]